LQEILMLHPSDAKLMKLEFLKDINTYNDHVMRLYDFDKQEAIRFRHEVQQFMLTSPHIELELGSLDFITEVNCSLTLRISAEDTGITTDDQTHFVCDLKMESYAKIILMTEPFCLGKTKGHHWLYDLDNPIGFLLSPHGEWELPE